jgi:hypothetical protein
VGALALQKNTTGNYNTAAGYRALLDNTTGTLNTAAGVNALIKNTTGNNNTAVGNNTLFSNVAGFNNTATGYGALFSSTASNNTAQGFYALNKNTTGPSNTAVGVNALLNNTTGANNIAVGVGAGQTLTIGNNNIEIGNAGLAGETNAIRIGKQGTQTQTYIAGISVAPVTGSTVVINAAGRLGVVLSSARYKHDIHDMGMASSKMLKLRPVTFRYNNDPVGNLQYGLVAEEVANVYPELVTRGLDGKVESVNYLSLTSMLLNELQKRTAENERQVARLAALEQRLSTLERTTAGMPTALPGE